MRKARLVAALIAVLLLVVSAGCLREEPQEQANQRGFDLEDGTYTAQTEPDSHNWYAKNDITITDGKITEVDYREINAETEEVKGPDYQYQKAVDAQETLEKDLLEKQDPDEVDAIAGATQTWERFKSTAKEALRMAD